MYHLKQERIQLFQSIFLRCQGCLSHCHPFDPVNRRISHLTNSHLLTQLRLGADKNRLLAECKAVQDTKFENRRAVTMEQIVRIRKGMKWSATAILECWMPTDNSWFVIYLFPTFSSWWGAGGRKNRLRAGKSGPRKCVRIGETNERKRDRFRAEDSAIRSIDEWSHCPANQTHQSSRGSGEQEAGPGRRFRRRLFHCETFGASCEKQ